MRMVKGTSLNSASLAPKPFASSVYVHAIEPLTPLQLPISVTPLFPSSRLSLESLDSASGRCAIELLLVRDVSNPVTSDHWTKPALVAKSGWPGGSGSSSPIGVSLSPCSSHLKPITSGTRSEFAETCSRTGTGSSAPSAVRRFGTSLTRGTVTEKFALEPVSLVRGVAMTTLPPPERFVLDGSVGPGNRSGQAPSIGTDRGNEAPGAT